jgi:hypothetical protein
MTFRPKFYTEQQDTVVHLAELEKEIAWNERRLFTSSGAKMIGSRLRTTSPILGKSGNGFWWC